MYSGDVENVKRNYPLGMSIAIILVFLSLFIPVFIGIGACDEPYTQWRGNITSSTLPHVLY